MTKRVSRSADAARETAAQRPRRSLQRASFKKRIKTLFALAFLAIEIPVALLFVAFLSFFHRFSADLPNLESITDIKGPTATTVWSQDGVKLGSLDVENRQPIPLDKMPKALLNATIAIEDHRFYEHQGVDLPGIVRAAWVNLRGGSTRQGASTLTQQLVRAMTSLGISREKSVSRKAKEILTAVRLEQFYTKKEILQLYLNNVYYGAGSYGIQAASETYFGKSAYKLDLAECALLAGLPQRPRSFTPFEHRKDALKRRDEVLDAMERWNYITADECAAAKDEPPKIMPQQKRRDYDFKAPYFTRYVLRELVKKYGVDFVESGIRIDTTLDMRLQRAAEKALEEGLQRNRRVGANQGALISLDEANGYIRAMVGGRDFHRDQYNIVTQGRRPPGSTFKIFDYAAAFDTDQFSLKDGFVDRPIPYPGDPEHRVVRNEYGETSGKWMNFKDAIRLSKNTIAIQVAQVVGMSTINEYAHKMGVTSELSPYLPTAIGATAIHAIDLCSAYSLIANHGSRCFPMAVIRITTADGEDVDPASFLPQVQEPAPLKQSTVSQLDEAFLAVCASGTGVPARGTEQTGIIENAHGKTGTTDEFRDVWFAGYTPELTTVVWVGSVARDKSGHPVYNSMHGATGGHTCGQIWHDYMVEAVPIQRLFQAANPDISNSSMGTTPTPPSIPAKRRRRVVPTTLRPPTPGLDSDLQDQESPDPTTNLPGQPGGGDTRPVEPGAIPDTGASVRSNGATRAAPPSTGLRSSQPASTPASPQLSSQTSRPPDEELISVKVCAESGDLVNGNWCPEYILKRVTRSAAQHMRRCRLHHAPPGEKE